MFEAPFRVRLVEGLKAALEAITPANDYAHDLTDKVFCGRTLFGDSDPLPMVAILEAPQAPETFVSNDLAEPSSRGLGTIVFLIQGFMADDDEDNPSLAAYALLADVRRCLAAQRVRTTQHSRATAPLGMGREYSAANNVIDLDVGFGTVRPPDDYVSDKTNLWLTVTLRVAEDANNPFL